ncbi:MAG TPA: ArdC-like ssDNA-binding domain-containing protein [Acidimicrobiales bacterium]
MAELSELEKKVQITRAAYVTALKFSDPDAELRQKTYAEALAEYNYAIFEDALAQGAGESSEPVEFNDTLIQVTTDEYKVEGLGPLYFAQRVRETTGESEITEERFWDILATDLYVATKWVAEESPSEAMAYVNALLSPDIEKVHEIDTPVKPMALNEEELFAPLIERTKDEERVQTRDRFEDRASAEVNATLAPEPAKKAPKKYTTKDRSDLVDKLTEGIANLTTSEKWAEYLKFQSRFTRYSAQNTSLIMYQDPYASQVAGYDTWKKQGRFVKKGESGISILAPLIYKEKDEDSGEEKKGIKGFRWVSVFDVRQTEGEDLPEIARKLTGEDSEHIYEELVKYAASIGSAVHDHEFEGGPNGDYDPRTKEIRVEAKNSGIQRVKTLAHELGHALLHATSEDGDEVRLDCTAKNVKELEAESTAYVVCAALGIETDDYSFGYVVGWAGGGDQAIEKIRASQARIQKTSGQILKQFEQERELVIAEEKTPEEIEIPLAEVRGGRDQDAIPTFTDGWQSPGESYMSNKNYAFRRTLAELKAERAEMEEDMRLLPHEIQAQEVYQVSAGIQLNILESELKNLPMEIVLCESEITKEERHQAALVGHEVLEGEELAFYLDPVETEVTRQEKIISFQREAAGDRRVFACRVLERARCDARKVIESAGKREWEQRERMQLVKEGMDAEYELLTKVSGTAEQREEIISRIEHENVVNLDWLTPQKAELKKLREREIEHEVPTQEIGYSMAR